MRKYVVRECLDKLVVGLQEPQLNPKVGAIDAQHLTRGHRDYVAEQYHEERDMINFDAANDDRSRIYIRYVTYGDAFVKNCCVLKSFDIYILLCFPQGE